MVTMNAMPDTSRPRRRGRRTLAAFVFLFALLLAAVALGPSLVSWGLGRGFICRALEGNVNGTVHIDRLDLGWFGAQTVEGLQVRNDAGSAEARFDVLVNAGLLELVRGATGTLEIDLAGSMRGIINEDGSTSLEDLFKSGTSPRGTRARGGPVGLQGIPPTTIRLAGISVELKDAPTQQVVGLEDLKGTVVYGADGGLAIDARGTAKGGAQDGSIVLVAAVGGLFDEAGVLHLDRAAGHVDLTMRDVPVALASRRTDLRALTLTARSDDLTDRLEFSIRADAMIEQVSTGRLEGDITVERPVRPDGTLSVGLEQITGRVVGRSVPTALFQHSLRGTPIIAERDIGPTADIDAAFGGRDGTVEISAAAEAVEMEFSGTVDPQDRSVRADLLTVAFDVSPALVESVTGYTIGDRASGTLALDTLTLPALDTGAASLGGVAFAGTLAMETPLAIAKPDGSLLVTVEDLSVDLESAGLSDGATVRGAALVDGAQSSFQYALTGFLAADGSFRPDRLRPAGTTTILDLETTALARLSGRAGLVTAALREPVDITIEMTEDLRARILVESDEVQFDLTAVPQGDTTRIDAARGTVLVRPELVAALLGDSASPVALAAPARVTFEAVPFNLPRDVARLREMTFHARLGAESLTLTQVPGLAEPLGIRGLAADVSVQPGEPLRASATGTAGLRRAATSRHVASAQYDLAVEGATLPKARIELTDIALGELDGMRGKGDGDLASLLGTPGTLTVALDDGHASLDADFPHVKGALVATPDGDMIDVTADGMELSLSREAIQNRVSLADDRVAPPVRVAEDVPLDLDIRQLRVPRALLVGGTFDPARVTMDVGLAGGPLVLIDAGGGRSTVDGLAIELDSRDLARGIDLSVKGRVGHGGGGPQGSIEADGRLTGLVTAGMLTPHEAALEMTAQVDNLHTAVVDALANFKGMLVAAVGPRVDARLEGRGFSRNSGSLDVDIITPNGTLEGRLLGRDKAFVIDADKPVIAQLAMTEPLRQRLLYKIHPVLADIRSTEHPARARVTAGTIPMDGDVSRLNADLELTVGKVEFDAGSAALGVLLLAQQPAVGTIPGEIEPIEAKIRNGVVTYKRFKVHVDRYTFAYSGTINLNTRQVRLKTEVPLEAVARQVKEFRRRADEIYVPVYLQGEFGKLTATIDPEELAAAIAQATAGGFIDEQLEKQGIPKEVGDLLEGIFGGKKKK